jgi:hypothetical protein
MVDAKTQSALFVIGGNLKGGRVLKAWHGIKTGSLRGLLNALPFFLATLNLIVLGGWLKRTARNAKLFYHQSENLFNQFKRIKKCIGLKFHI